MDPKYEAAVAAAGDQSQRETFFSRTMAMLERIRHAVVRSSQIGKIKLDSTFLRRERDDLLRELGAGVYSLKKAQKLELPPDFDAVLERIGRLDQGIAEQERELAVVEAEPRSAREAPPSTSAAAAGAGSGPVASRDPEAEELAGNGSRAPDPEPGAG